MFNLQSNRNLITMNIKMHKKFVGLYHRPGILDDSTTGMEWMEKDYDFRTLREVTENCSVSDYLNQLLEILLINTPNYISFAHSLGTFQWKNDTFASTEIFNKEILKITMYPLAKTTAYKEELGEIIIEFPNKSLLYSGVLEMLAFHRFQKQRENDDVITSSAFLCSRKMRRMPINEEIILNVTLNAHEMFVSCISFSYQ